MSCSGDNMGSGGNSCFGGRTTVGMIWLWSDVSSSVASSRIWTTKFQRVHIYDLKSDTWRGRKGLIGNTTCNTAGFLKKNKLHFSVFHTFCRWLVQIQANPSILAFTTSYNQIKLYLICFCFDSVDLSKQMLPFNIIKFVNGLTVTHPACSLKHLEIQRVSRQPAIYFGERVAGGHASNKLGFDKSFLVGIFLWQVKTEEAGEIS